MMSSWGRMSLLLTCVPHLLLGMLRLLTMRWNSQQWRHYWLWLDSGRRLWSWRGGRWSFWLTCQSVAIRCCWWRNSCWGGSIGVWSCSTRWWVTRIYVGWRTGCLIFGAIQWGRCVQGLVISLRLTTARRVWGFGLRRICRLMRFLDVLTLGLLTSWGTRSQGRRYYCSSRFVVSKVFAQLDPMFDVRLRSYTIIQMELFWLNKEVTYFTSN